MERPEINSEELVPWCERRGVDASLLVAEQPQQWHGSDGIHYRLRLPGEGWHYVDVVAPHDDPMPPIIGCILDGCLMPETVRHLPWPFAERGER